MSEQLQQQIECKPAKDPIVRRLILAAMLIGFGLWCMTDLREYVPLSQDINKFFNWMLNNVGSVVFPVAGLIPLVMAIAHSRSLLVATPEGVGYRGKKQFGWSEITEVDATQLAKGFIFLYRGREKMTLDSYKYQGFRELVKAIEQNVSADKIKR